MIFILHIKTHMGSVLGPFAFVICSLGFIVHSGLCHQEKHLAGWCFTVCQFWHCLFFPSHSNDY